MYVFELLFAETADEQLPLLRINILFLLHCKLLQFPEYSDTLIYLEGSKHQIEWKLSRISDLVIVVYAGVGKLASEPNILPNVGTTRYQEAW